MRTLSCIDSATAVLSVLTCPSPLPLLLLFSLLSWFSFKLHLTLTQTHIVLEVFLWWYPMARRPGEGRVWLLQARYILDQSNIHAKTHLLSLKLSTATFKNKIKPWILSFSKQLNVFTRECTSNTSWLCYLS